MRTGFWHSLDEALRYMSSGNKDPEVVMLPGVAYSRWPILGSRNSWLWYRLMWPLRA